MKNSIAIFSLTALAAASVQTASAGDREWATVGKILTGVAAVHAIGHAIHHAPVHVVAPVPVVRVHAPPVVVSTHRPRAYYPHPHPAPVVVYAPPVCVPAPVFVAPRYYPPPAVRVSIGFGHHDRYHGHHHGRRPVRHHHR